MSIFDATSGRNKGSEKPQEGALEQTTRALELAFSDQSAFAKAAERPSPEAMDSMQKKGELPTMNPRADGSGWDIPPSQEANLFSTGERTPPPEQKQAA